ncbi:MAG: tRNA (adenosine(37)-N6)-threonylcarbamoyltransferase complex dimerization subunit type 1 TsaB [Gammaproteobacteria bacterium]
MKLLAVDTATEACSAALIIEGTVIERYQKTQRGHSLLILPMIDSLMAEAGLKPNDLDCLAFGRGPGSFTGVRIAAGVIQGIALGTGLPVVPVSTLAALAQDFFDGSIEEQGRTSAVDAAFTAIDARMGEIYWAVYRRGEGGFAELAVQEAVISAGQVKYSDLEGVGLGTGWAVYREELMRRLQGKVSRFDGNKLPRAGAIARLGWHGFEQGLAVEAALALPVYLRDKVAKKESER